MERAETAEAKFKKLEMESMVKDQELVSLQHKIALLESELDNAEKNLRETTDKLRQVDVKAEHFERQVQRIESERDSWEKK
ncbi:hypothetical protein PGTUg99_001038 [Puccinia graminis f. sp. tritici]|uniref:Uncharacterized protein n=1 Tax=Puccinia graminis f. sp. tritici TaxID=56615 RepID=A0A5B0SAE6_PUCGR|nr:hypothetical protein PGTUg99_001038 [Puccinia graminis f. sp. tritici]